jgi:hypothetical protein
MGDVHHLEIAAPAEPAEHRAAVRRRVLMRAAIRMPGQSQEWALTVKDLSSTGMKAMAPVSMFPGTRVEICLPNIGWVSGEIARIEGESAVGIRFGAVIDPECAQTRVSGSNGAVPVATQLRRV